MKGNEFDYVVFEEAIEPGSGLTSVAQDIVPKTFAKKFKQLKKAQEELEAIENEIKEKLKVMFESITDLQTNSVVVDGIKFTYVKATKRKSVDTKKLQEEYPEIYKKMLKETDVKSSIRTSIDY